MLLSKPTWQNSKHPCSGSLLFFMLAQEQLSTSGKVLLGLLQTQDDSSGRNSQHHRAIPLYFSCSFVLPFSATSVSHIPCSVNKCSRCALSSLLMAGHWQTLRFRYHLTSTITPSTRCHFRELPLSLHTPVAPRGYPWCLIHQKDPASLAS